MKKIAGLAVAASVLLFALAGCGGKNTTNNTNTTTSSQTTNNTENTTYSTTTEYGTNNADNGRVTDHDGIIGNEESENIIDKAEDAVENGVDQLATAASDVLR